MAQFRRKRERRIGAIRELTRDDLIVIESKERRSLPAVIRFRDTHHNVARLFALGYRMQEVAEYSGYSVARVRTLHEDPAFQELITQKRETVDGVMVPYAEAYSNLLVGNRMMAERQLRDKLEEADENGETLPVRDLIAIGRDAADRTGFGKTNTTFNVSSDFATLLDRAVKESNKVIEGTVVKVGPQAPKLDVAPALAAVSSRRF